MPSFTIVSLSVCALTHSNAISKRGMVPACFAGIDGRLALSSSSGSRHGSMVHTAPRPSGALAAYVQQLRSPPSRSHSCNGSGQAHSSVLSS